MPFFTSGDGTIIHYEETGSGQPLVFVHGWAMSGRVWRFQRELAENFRVIEIDLRGHGSSSMPTDAITLHALATDIAALHKVLDLESSVLVGWSLGAQAVLKAFPFLGQRVSGLVLVGGTSRFTAGAGYEAGLPLREVRGLDARLKREFAKAMGEFFRRMFTAGELTREQENRVAREVVMGGRLPELGVARQGLQILAQEDLRGLLPDIDRPVLLVHGEGDTICPPAAARYMTERLPRSGLQLLEKRGHAPFLSHPEEFNHILFEFVRGLHGGA